MRTDLLTGVALVAALLLLAGILVAMRADTLFIRRRLEAEGQALRLWAHGLADASFDGLIIHRQGVILLMNRAIVRLLAVREREWLGQNFATAAREDDVAGLRAELEAPGPIPTRFHLLRANKGEFIVEMSSQSIEFEGQPATITAIRDITNRLDSEAKIARLTDYDALTNLPNRKHFERMMEAAVAANDRHGTLSLFLTDIHDFKTINQQVGRAGGDALLQLLSTRISALLNKQDVLARLGGDKFAVLLPGEGPPHRARTLGGQLLAACNEPFVVEGKLINLQLRIGLASFPDHAADLDGLMQACELALDRAEQSNGAALHMFRHEDALPGRAREDATALRGDLRTALARGEIRMLFQPLFSLPDLTLHGFEATARWQHVTQGPLAPEQFMAIAESAGLAPELGSHIIERACAEAATAQVKHLSMRLCPAQLRDQNLPARLAAILRKTGLAPSALEIGITEAMLAEHADETTGILQALHHTGVGIALEDFGAGAAALGTLCHLPLTRLKIGRRFVQKLGRDRNADAMVSATLSLAANLRLQVTATDVENEIQLVHLRSHGCHAVQGRLLGEAAARAVYHNPHLSLAAE